MYSSPPKLIFVCTESRYNIYLYKDTFSRNKYKREYASFDIKKAIQIASRKINAFDDSIARASRTWFVVI